jgi:hypothetical protein
MTYELADANTEAIPHQHLLGRSRISTPGKLTT